MTGPRLVRADEYDFSKAPVFRKTATLAKADVEIASRDQTVVTVIDGFEETRNLARAGDYIVTGPKGERYVLQGSKFGRLYEVDPEHPERYRSRNVVRAITLAEPVELMAPWGELQRAAAGGRLCQSVADASDVYLIAGDLFEKTYAPVAPCPTSAALRRWVQSPDNPKPPYGAAA